MKSLNSFLNPQRKPNAKVKLAGFAEPFELKVVSREDEAEMMSKTYENLPQNERLNLYVAYGLVNPDLRNKELLDALNERDGKRYLEPLDALYAILNTNEINALFAEYSKLADLTQDFSQKVEEAKN